MGEITKLETFTPGLVQRLPDSFQVLISDQRLAVTEPDQLVIRKDMLHSFCMQATRAGYDYTSHRDELTRQTVFEFRRGAANGK